MYPDGVGVFRLQHHPSLRRKRFTARKSYISDIPQRQCPPGQPQSPWEAGFVRKQIVPPTLAFTQHGWNLLLNMLNHNSQLEKQTLFPLPGGAKDDGAGGATINNTYNYNVTTTSDPGTSLDDGFTGSVSLDYVDDYEINSISISISGDGESCTASASVTDTKVRRRLTLTFENGVLQSSSTTVL